MLCLAQSKRGVGVNEVKARKFYSTVQAAVSRRRITALVAEEAIIHVIMALAYGNVAEADAYADSMIKDLFDA